MYKVTQQQRAILNALATPGAFIRLGTISRSLCTVYNHKVFGYLIQFRHSTLVNLKTKGLVKEDNTISQTGIEAAIKGYYMPKTYTNAIQP